VPASGLTPPPAYLDELRHAAARREASFPQMFMARLLAGDPRFGPQVNFEVANLIPLLLDGLQSRYGDIIGAAQAWWAGQAALRVAIRIRALAPGRVRRSTAAERTLIAVLAGSSPPLTLPYGRRGAIHP
jgi:hypothetical protein